MSIFTVFLKNRNFISKIRISNITDYAALINDIECNKDSKIYPQNQIILDCIMSSIPLKHMCLSIILIWVIVSHK